ncbi:acyltransferase family protein [Leptospira sp. WS58.C1]|uniref:acyltransferase family protein n=1 Tax=Leptospira cinconiae TaxID=3235173 RepID=UPI00349E9A6C
MKYLFSKNESELPALNGLRALSIFLVIIFHLGPIFKTEELTLIHVLQNFRTGVDLFFILSGFLIYGGLLAEYEKTSKLDLKIFYVKRTLRIMPAYYFCILINYFYTQKTYKLFDKIPNPNTADIFNHQKLENMLSNSWGDFLYLSNYFRERLFEYGWSLSVEEQFYLVVPPLCMFLLFRVTENLRRNILIVLFFLPLIFRIVYFFWGIDRRLVEVHTETRFDFLILGMLIAELLRWKPLFFKQRNIKIDLLFSVCIIVTLLFSFQQTRVKVNSIFIFTLFQFGYGLLFIVALIKGSFWNKIFSFSFFRPIARVSYTMYLWHAGLSGIALFLLYGNSNVELTNFGTFLLVGLLTTLFVFLVCIPIFYITERPFLALRDHLVKRLKNKKSETVVPN